MKAYLIINKHVSTNNKPLLEGVFWKKKHAREYARQLTWKTGILNYKFLYCIKTYRSEIMSPTPGENTTSNKHFEVILHGLTL